MEALIPSGNNSAAAGFINNTTFKYDLVYGNSGKPIGVRSHLYNYNNKLSFWYWKIDESITKAYEAFDEGDLDKAEYLFTIACPPMSDALKYD